MWYGACVAHTLPNLTPDQHQALVTIVQWLTDNDRPYLTLGGYAGTGKTTLIAALRAELSTKEGWSNKTVAFCSYTGKAASVLRRRLQDFSALKPGDSCSTIHSLIYRPHTSGEEVVGWQLSPNLAYNLIIVDEGSMVNQVIWRDLTSFRIPILVVGDHGQLPPIDGQFNLLEKPHIRLDQIVRQAADNPIIQLSADIREGIMPPVGTYGQGVRRISPDDPDLYEAVDDVLQGSATDTLCLCGRNKTRVRLNQRARQAREYESNLPVKGERVICLRNNHAKAIYNGMVGQVLGARPLGEHWLEAEIDFEELSSPFRGTLVRSQFLRETTLKPEEVRAATIDDPRQLYDLYDYGYALTVHKSQGSEARKVVVLAERMQAYDNLMWRRWLYTAVTRAREELVLIG